MEGACRILNPHIQEQLPGRMKAIIKGITESMGDTYEFEYVKGFIPTVNNPQRFALVRDAAQTLVGSQLRDRTGQGCYDLRGLLLLPQRSSRCLLLAWLPKA